MGHIFWGYIFLLFDLRIVVNLTPDFLGYLLLCEGLRRLAGESDEFEKASPWALGLMIVELARIFLLNALPSSIPLILFNFCVLAASLYLRYRIICGIGELEGKYRKNLGEEPMRFLWKVQAVLESGCALLSRIPYAAAGYLVTVLAVAGLILNIFFLVFLHRARRTLETDETTLL